ncbi:MAG: transporter, partial [Rikenellaceae bacterium]|nr:transporter [Rikenellaceae bacterium]
MKNKAYLFAALAMSALSSAGYGQTGILMTQSDLTHTDLFRLSSTGTQFGTARSVAMGSAFTSLGADLVSMHINPAGLGMYQTSEIGITPMITWNKIDNSNLAGYISNGSNGR